MTPEDRVRDVWHRWHTPGTSLKQLMADEIRAAVEAEREECAKIADGQKLNRPTSSWGDGYNVACHVTATAIRERKP